MTAVLLWLVIFIVVVIMAWFWGWKRIDFFRGMIVTKKNMLKHKETIRFPEQSTPRSNRFRGLLALRRYKDGTERCIACQLCSASCPALAIEIESEQAQDGTRRAKRFDIDMFKCVHCGLCQRACPTDAIVLTHQEHYVLTSRAQHIMTKEKLLFMGDLHADDLKKNLEQERDFI